MADSPKIGEPFRPWRRFRRVVVLPEVLLAADCLSDGAKLCWGRLARYEGKDGAAYPSTETLGAELGVLERQARRYVAELEYQGFIRRESQPGKTNRFLFLWHRVFESPIPRSEKTAPPRSEKTGRAVKCDRQRESARESDGRESGKRYLFTAS